MAYVYLVIALATLVVPFLLGSFFGKKLRMPEHGWKIGVCLFSLMASVVMLWLGPPIKLGVDLRGGAILVYEIDPAKREPGKPVDMDRLIAAVSRRVNPGGQKEVTIRPSGADQIEIIIPEVDNAELDRVEKTISRAGTLEFRIIANERDHKSLIERARAEPLSTKVVKDAEGTVDGWWIPVQPGREKEFLRDITRTVKHGDKTTLEVLVAADPYNVTGQYLVRAEPETDQQGRPAVGFSFNNTGGRLFGQLTSENLPDTVQNFYRQLGIILDGELYSAPQINSTINDRGIIEGSFTPEQVQDQINVLNAGSLPATLTKEPISVLYSGPTLGRDTIIKSRDAMLIACILVPIFMLWYYRFSGIVADIALVLNMLILVAVMVAIKAAFTLTGLAGLALTVGMAVDNNVLVFERLREERERGATLRMAIRNAFQRASATIIDCNLSHLIAATVLYIVGTDQIRGFAITLWLGVAISMYTSVFVARVIFEIAEKRQWIKELKMMHLIRHTSIDFMHWFPLCASASILITVLGLAVAFHRGKGLFDIDFTGGVSVQAQFTQPQAPGAVRDALRGLPKAEQLPDLAVSDVRTSQTAAGLQFVVNTSEPDLGTVQRTLAKVFGDKLARNEMTFSQPTLVQAPAKAAAAKPAAATAPAAEKKSAAPSAGKVKPEHESAALPAAPAKPAAAKPASEKSKAGPLPAAPPKKPQTGSLSRTDRWLAMAGHDLSFLALADAPAEKPAAKSDGASNKKPEAKAAPTATRPTPPTSSAKTPAGPAAAGQQNRSSEAEAETAAAASFAGGSRSKLTFQTKLDYKAVEDLMNEAAASTGVSHEAVRLQLFNPEYVEGEAKRFADWTVMMQLPPQQAQKVLVAAQKHLAAAPFFPAASTIGGAVAGNTRVIAVYALIASWLGIIVYLWVRFQGVAFGLAAVIALIHDVLVALGGVAVSYYVADWMPHWMGIEPFKINLPIIAAFLTIIGYSVNDTIVVFDRIREVRGKDPNMTPKMINDSTNQTMSRTLLTSLTVFLVVVVLYFFGGDALHGFAFSMLVGVVTGTYSSIYVAAPTLLWLIGHKKNQPQLAAGRGAAAVPSK